MKMLRLVLCLAFAVPAFAQVKDEKPVAARFVAVPMVEALKDMRVTDLKKRDVKRELPANFEKGTVSMLGSRWDQLAVKPEVIETRVLDKSQVMELPGFAVIAPSSSPVASGAGDKALELFRLTFFASPLPAVWDLEKQSYTTTVTFGLKASSGEDSGDGLAEPVEVKVAFQGLAALEPEPLLIEGPGLQKEKSFVLDFKPTTEQPTLLVRSTISDVDLELRAVSRIALQSARKEILGFGLEEAVFDVSEFQPHGALVENVVSVPISVSVEGRGRVEPEQPAFAVGQARSQFKVRSSGLGAMQVEARVGDAVAVASVAQLFPVSPLLAVLFGGALGGFARRFIKGAPSSKRGRWILEGLVVSLIAFVAGVLGVGNLGIPSAIVATEAGAFLTGALSGFVGVVLLEKLTASLGKE